MPDITGVEMAKKILSIRPQIPIILCTGFSTTVSRETARSFGIKGFALKPLVRKELALLIRKVLDEN
jgi:YesN/AraC family two-component response regulator